MSDYPPNKVIPGTVYMVIQLLGQGGMGTVYEVEDTTVGKRYVLKTLHAQLRDRHEIAARLHKEARTLAKLSHPNIVEVVTAGLTGDSLKLPYFLMQKLNGHTLRSVLGAKGRLPLQTTYSIAIDLLDALDHAHAAGVIHRDVKPENIFLHRGPNDAHQTKLLDFGVMRLLSGDEPQTGSRFVGTLRYAPPEQLRGAKVTPRTDLYAAGLVIYEMLAGRGPFDNETSDRSIASAHLQKAPPRLSTVCRVAPDLEALVMSSLAKDPESRPRDAFTFASRLRALARDAAAESARLSRPGTIDSLMGALEGPASPTNGDGMTVRHGAEGGPTDLASHAYSRQVSTTLENAGPPTAAPQTTLRLDLDPMGIDRSAPTRTAAPLAGDIPDAPGSATTMGAIESQAEAAPVRKTSPLVVGMVALATAGAVGIGVAARWSGRHASSAVTTSPPTATATASETASATASPTATASATATATASATPSAPPPSRPIVPRSPRRAPAPSPAPAATKPHLPGPGF